jgi:hypothetical protein
MIAAASRGMVVAALLSAWAVAAQPERPWLTGFELVCVDEGAIAAATFQSHNQKVVSNAHGVFMTYLRTRNEAYTAQQLRLLRSVDGGRRFATLYAATHATNPPVLETDERANLYLVRPDFVDGNAYLYRFSPPGYSSPAVSKIPSGSAGKYAMIYDGPRRRLYYFAHNDTFHVLDLEGRVLRTTTVLKDGPDAVLQYPHLSLTPDGTLHAAWTTVRHGKYLYWDIHHLLSKDGGQTWQTMAGRAVALPAIADQHGPADRVIRDDEYEVHTWLSSFLAKDGKLHFTYLAQSQPPREHYLRCDLATARRDVDIWPKFCGERIELQGLDGFFASRASLPDAPLYCVMGSQGRLACLASDDNGHTWYDYALSDKSFRLYAVGGCRELTEDGWIIGSFTDARDEPPNRVGQSHVYFFRTRAGLSRAKVSDVQWRSGTATLKLSSIRGQPEAIRLDDGSGSWGDWTKFRPEMTLAIPSRPTRFQLRSRLGVVSEPQAIPARSE